MTPLLACPVHSHPRAKLFARPMAHQCTRAMPATWFLVPGFSCDHFGVFDGWNTGADPEPLIAHWNERAMALAAELSAKRGHNSEQAAAFLASLGPESYTRAGFGGF